MMNNPKITIVTVTYNCVSLVENTIQSVLSQTYPNMEYIIIDGLSNDGTVDIIKQYENKLAFWCSENDKGIFDAMNKGLKYATGEWINFMNAGDLFANEHVIEYLFKEVISDNIGFVFGNFNTLMPGGKKIPQMVRKPFFKNNHFFRPMGIHHQAIFTRTKLAQQHQFNLSYKVAADYNMINAIHESGYVSKYFDIPIVSVDTTGFSVHNARLQRMEVARICHCEKRVRFKIFNGYLSIRYGIKTILLAALIFFRKRNENIQ